MTEPTAELIRALRDVLERDSMSAPSGISNDCRCSNLSRDAEREYETGTCPHQRARTLLAANQAAPAERATVIEECAKVADAVLPRDGHHLDMALRIAAAIRALSPPTRPNAEGVDTTKLDAGQLVQRIMRAMDHCQVFPTTANLAEHIAAEILSLPKNYWRKPEPDELAAVLPASEARAPAPNESGCKNKGGECGCVKYCADSTAGVRVKEPPPASEKASVPRT